MPDQHPAIITARIRQRSAVDSNLHGLDQKHRPLVDIEAVTDHAAPEDVPARLGRLRSGCIGLMNLPFGMPGGTVIAEGLAQAASKSAEAIDNTAFMATFLQWTKRSTYMTGKSSASVHPSRPILGIGGSGFTMTDAKRTR